MNRTIILFLTLVAGLSLTQGCSSKDNADMGPGSIAGTVTYRERMMIPPDAVATVTLEDVARADAKAELIATTTVVHEGGPPWKFTLEYDKSKITDRGRYALRGRIEADGQLMFTSTEHIPAFDHDADAPVEIMLSRVGGEDAKTDGGIGLTEAYWKLVELDGRPVALGADEKELHMMLTVEDQRIRGYAGCNDFAGPYMTNDDKLQIGPLVSTKKACVETMEQEDRFLEALGDTKQYRLSGGELTFLNGEDQVLLRFVYVVKN